MILNFSKLRFWLIHVNVYRTAVYNEFKKKIAFFVDISLGNFVFLQF